jgi:hypothetical protein
LIPTHRGTLLLGIVLLGSLAFYVAVATALGFLLTGCKSPEIVTIPADRKISWVTAGSTNPAPGYYVPPARMQEILRALGTSTNTP